MGYTHDQLCDKAVQYLSTTGGFPIVCKEMHSTLTEIPDVYAVNRHFSVVIECKTTHSDFERDAKKRFRKYPKEGLGRYRYYFCEPDVIKPEELPKKWGLIYLYPDQSMRMIVGKVFGHHRYDDKYRFQEDYRNECEALYSLVRKAVSWDFGKNGIWKYRSEDVQ